MEKRFASDIINIFGHRFDGKDTINYRVQWEDRSCEWVDGSSLNNQKYAKYLIKYWQIGPHEFTDIEIQTEPCSSFDFSITESNITNWTSSFRSFVPQDQIREPYCLIPYSIESIDVENKIALVHNFEDSPTTEMDLNKLLLLAPKMIAEFYMSKQ